MTTVWIVNHYAIDPAESASGSRHYSLARQLAAMGWTPVIIAASTDHPSGRQRPRTTGRLTDRSRAGVTFRFIRSPGYGGGYTRVVNILAFTLGLLRRSSVAGLPHPDVVIGSTVHPLAAWAASVLSRRMGVPFVFEIRDLWPQTLIDMGKLSERGLPAKWLRRLEGILCRRADAIVTLLPFAHEYLASQGVALEKVTWISNGVDLEDFPVVARPVGESFTFMYLGSIGRANGVSAIVDAFILASSTQPRMRLQIVGDGAERAVLEERVRDSGKHDNVQFRSPVPKSDVPAVIAGADALVMNVLDLDVYRYGVSMNKLFDYGASGRPVIIASSARNNMVADCDGGIVTAAGDVSGLAAAMVTMADPKSEDARLRWGLNARRHVSENYDYRVLGARFEELLRQVVAGHGGRDR